MTADTEYRLAIYIAVFILILAIAEVRLHRAESERRPRIFTIQHQLDQPAPPPRSDRQPSPRVILWARDVNTPVDDER